MKTKFLAVTAAIAVAGMLASADSAQAGRKKKHHKNHCSYQQANWNGYYRNNWNNGSCGYYRPVRSYQPCYQPVYYNSCAPRSGFRGFLSVLFGP